MTDNLPAVIEPIRKQDPIYRALRELGIKTVRLTYSGSCDSGCINEVEALNNDDKLVVLPQTLTPYTFTHTTYDFQAGGYSTTTSETKELPLSEAVEQWCYDLLEEHHPGWEINEGSSGEMIIDPIERQGNIGHTFLVPDYVRRSFQ
jgi:hypothetical protein